MRKTEVRIGPWAAIALMALVFAAMELVLPPLRQALAPHVTAPRDVVAVRALSSIALVWILFAAACVLLKLRGQSLADVGWGKPARIEGWLLAILFAALYGGGFAYGMAKQGVPVLSDWSFFRIWVALGIAVSAGICEETVFRGFVMSQARDGGAHWSVQLALSALLFGLAHMGWGGLSGHVDMGQMIGAVMGTAILGVMMAATYLVGGRSLWPAILAHGVIDLLLEPWLLLNAVTGGHF